MRAPSTLESRGFTVRSKQHEWLNVRKEDRGNICLSKLSQSFEGRLERSSSTNPDPRRLSCLESAAIHARNKARCETDLNAGAAFLQSEHLAVDFIFKLSP
jgi:hypothetical protein